MQSKIILFEDKLLYVCVCWYSLVAKSCLTLTTPRTVALLAPLSMGFPWQEYWSELPFPSPGDLPDPGIKPMSPPLAGGFFIHQPPQKPGCGLGHSYFCGV